MTAWWLCPNEPRCGHAAAVHDVYDAEDEVPRCCAEGCMCGGRLKEGPMTREEYAAFTATVEQAARRRPPAMGMRG